MSQINTGKRVYVGKAWLKKYVLRFFRKDKYVGAERIELGKWFQRNGAAWANERKPFDFLLKNGNVRGLKEEEQRTKQLYIQYVQITNTNLGVLPSSFRLPSACIRTLIKSVGLARNWARLPAVIPAATAFLKKWNDYLRTHVHSTFKVNKRET